MWYSVEVIGSNGDWYIQFPSSFRVRYYKNCFDCPEVFISSHKELKKLIEWLKSFKDFEVIERLRIISICI